MGFPMWLMRSDHSSRGIPVFEILHWGFSALHHQKCRGSLCSPASPLFLAVSVDLGLA
jgi:hypothetical protein